MNEFENMRRRINACNRMLDRIDEFNEFQQEWDAGTPIYLIMGKIRLLEQEFGIFAITEQLRNECMRLQNKYLGIRRNYAEAA